MKNDQFDVKVNKIHAISYKAINEEPQMIADGVQRRLNNLDCMHYAFTLDVEINDGKRPLQWSIFPMVYSQIVRTLEWTWESENFRLRDNSERNKNLDADFLARYFEQSSCGESTLQLKSEIQEKLREKIDEALSNCMIGIVQQERAKVEK